MLSDISSESLSKSLSSGKHERFPYFEEIQKKPNRNSHKEETRGILTTRFLNNLSNILLKILFIAVSRAAPHPLSELVEDLG